MTTTAPGWYDDGHGALRWWDGAQWTEHVAQPDPETDEAGDAPTEADIVAASEAEDAAGAPVGLDPAAAVGAGVPAPAGTPDYQAYAAGQPVGEPGPAVPTPPPAYPGATPGDYAGTESFAGGFAAATEPRETKSKLWVVWVVLGVVLLGIVIAAAVLIPLLLLGLASGGGSSQGTSGSAPSAADEQAAVSAVELYDDAWQDADCDAYLASTTESFRATSGLTDCETFVPEAQLFGETLAEYEVVVDEVVQEGETITVTTTESFVTLLDESGSPLAEPEPGTAVYRYVTVASDGGWAIDSLSLD